MRIRRQLIEPLNSRHRFAELSLTSENWFEKIDSSSEPFLLIIEGVSMYLQPREVHQILYTFGEKASSGSELVFDFMSWLSVGRARNHSPAMKHTRAEFTWGARNLRELTSQHRRLHLIAVKRPLKNASFLRSVLDSLFQTLSSVPFYGVARIRVK
jgi:O-methyltransferase involved in polyketide biosynthesis